MPRMSSLVQMPVRSGWPQAVFGAFQFGSFAFAAVVSAGIDRSFEGVTVGPKPRPCAYAAVAATDKASVSTADLFMRKLYLSSARRASCVPDGVRRGPPCP